MDCLGHNDMDSSSLEQIDFCVHRDEELNLGRSQKSPCQIVKAQKSGPGD